MDVETPAWELALIYWLHMLATVLWIGGLAALIGLILPIAGRVLEPEALAKLLEHIQRRLDPLGWFCLLVLVGTGMFQMSANPNYQGFFAIQNTWSAAILLKHGVFLGILAVSAWNTWGALPALRRAVLRLAQGKTDPQAEALRLRTQRLMQVNLGLAAIVLALTALARAAN